MRLLFLGDVHGNFNIINQYVKIYGIKNAHIVQLGDFGVGFHHYVKEKRMLEHCNEILVANNVHVWAVRGNHDNKKYFDKDPFELTNIHLVPDYTVHNLAGKNILFIGGAVSVDREYRYTRKQKLGIFENEQVGVETWWPDEYFVYDEDKLANFRDINIVVTHTAPHYCTPDNTNGFGYFVEKVVANTGDYKLKGELTTERNLVTKAFQMLKMNNNIELHMYGHFHDNDVLFIDNTLHKLLDQHELWECKLEEDKQDEK